MNILIIGKFYTEGFAEHIAETFEGMGHLVTRFQPGRSYKSGAGKLQRYYYKGKAVINDVLSSTPWYQEAEKKRLLRAAGSQAFDLALVCHDFLTPDQAQALKLLIKAPLALWFPDAVSNFRSAMFLNAPYDFLFFKEPFAVKILRNELNKNVFYLPECCNPKYHKPVDISPEELSRYACDITTAGNLHAARVAFFEQLAEYKVRIWGHSAPHWMHTGNIDAMIQHQFVSNEEKSKRFQAGKIVVNSLHPTEIFGTNVRTFEVAAACGFQIVSWRPGLSAFFEEDKEITAFKNIHELKEKVNYYLNSESERKAIALAGMKRAHRDHTYEKRLELMLATIFNPDKSETAWSLDKTYCL